MNTKERILTILLMEKAKSNRDFFAESGIEIKHDKTQKDMPDVTSKGWSSVK